MSRCFGPFVVRLESYVNENSRELFHFKKCVSAAGIFLCNDIKHFGTYEAVLFIYLFSMYLLHSPLVRNILLCLCQSWNIFLNPSVCVQKKLQLFKKFIRLCVNWLWVQIRMLTLMRGSFSKCFADYAAYPNEERDLSEEEAIYLCRDSRAGLESLTACLLSQ